jgi:hypothetical protein
LRTAGTATFATAEVQETREAPLVESSKESPKRTAIATQNPI